MKAIHEISRADLHLIGELEQVRTMFRKRWFSNSPPHQTAMNSGKLNTYEKYSGKLSKTVLNVFLVQKVREIGH